MRYLRIAILIVLFFPACINTNKCTKSLPEDLNLSVLPLWEKQTDIDINAQKDSKLTFLLRSEKDQSISMFDRRSFLTSNFFKIKQVNNQKFGLLIIVELNSSGERYRRIKYILASCGQKTMISKFQLNQGEWELIKVYEEKTEKLKNAIKSLKNSSDNTVYWGDNINDLVAISEFHNLHKIEVTVFGTLNKKQYQTLGLAGR